MHHSQGAILTKEKAEELQAKWKKEGNLPCEHPTQKLGRTDKGYLTGAWYCVDCGHSIDNSTVTFPRLLHQR